VHSSAIVHRPRAPVTLGVVVGLALGGLPAMPNAPKSQPRCAVPKAYGRFALGWATFSSSEDNGGTIRVVACLIGHRIE
jgi:hypothetical protein